jgi:hypothetical protein
MHPPDRRGATTDDGPVERIIPRYRLCLLETRNPLPVARTRTVLGFWFLVSGWGQMVGDPPYGLAEAAFNREPANLPT